MRTKESFEEKVRGKFRLDVFSPRVIKALQEFNPFKDTLDLAMQLWQQRKEGQGLYIYGSTGSGKTIMAAMILEEIKLQEFLHPEVCALQKNNMQFTTVPDLLTRLRNAFSTNKKEVGERFKRTEMDLIAEYSNVEYLVLDDLGGEKTADYSFQALYNIIDHRYENLKTTIIVSNLSLEELAKKLGDDRIPSRIRAMSQPHIYALGGKDKRLLVEGK